MENNVIYLSDASYDHLTKEAGIGVKNLATNESHCVFVHAVNVHEAEEFALIEAITHAITHHHRNCVFVYDNMGIDTKSIGEFFSKMFDQIQFLWMKRDYLKQVDKLACNVRLKHAKNANWIKQILTHASQISDEALVSALMPLTRGETYGYLCAISGSAPMMKPYPNNIKEVNEKIIALLLFAGSQNLHNLLSERFRHIPCYKQKLYDELLKAVEFDMSWFEAASRNYSKEPIAA
ncbi:MAG: hypothetical protein PHQ90_02705 [Sulfuricurvum sp.]|nr:hypothetical protein [Sulfuricurvum sp.]MDD2949224.1 hypothetical protein [Sulfuricurvum sp.]